MSYAFDASEATPEDIEWCKANLHGEWTYDKIFVRTDDPSFGPDAYTDVGEAICISDLRDATLFRLRFEFRYLGDDHTPPHVILEEEEWYE